MKKAFTLIELLVVIAIIAILAAILFPVFAQAKLAAKKTAGLNATKQIGLATNIYINDSDDVLLPYRWSVADAAPAVNPYYLSLAAGDPKKATLEAEGVKTIHAVFFNQMLQPYMKSNEMFKNQQYGNAWVNFQDKRLPADPGFHSYGGQNSYAANNYLLKKNEGFSATAVEGVSNTLLFVDASYYNTLPAQPTAGLCDLNGVVMRTNNDEYYWKHLGNNELNFTNKGTADPDSPDNVTTVKNVEARYSGVLNVVRVDSSAKAYNAKGLINDLRQKGTQSVWNPGKTQCQNGTIIPN